MITINLLPPELRRRSGPPVKVLAATAAATAAVSTLVAVWGWLAFGVAAEVESRRAQLALEMDGLRPQLQYNQSLDAEIRVAAARESKLATVNKERVVWTEKVDELIDVVNAGNEVEHFIWFDDLVVRQGAGAAGRGARSQPGSLQVAGHSGSGADPRSGLEKTAHFLDAVVDEELSSFMRDFETIESVDVLKRVARSEPDADLIPEVNWSFPLSLQLKDADARWAARRDEEASR